MKFIKSINVRYYRSLYEVKIENTKDLNVFSGKNDSGKSNILKVLDIFFNNRAIIFDEDFNKNRLEEVRKSIKGKQFIDIRITFINNGNYISLPSTFSVTKTFDRNGNLLGAPVDDLQRQIDAGSFNPKSFEVSKRSLTTYINKIKYQYIPGIRDELYFGNLLQRLQVSLFEREDRRSQTESSIRKTIKNFNQYIRGITETLNQDFFARSGIDSQLSFPSELTLLFRRLLVDTKSGNYEIPLYLRGDGIRLWYIPTILNFIAQSSPDYFIWGFDEPENSCEYTLANKLASDFIEIFSQKSQIFLSTHSFSFISIENDRCAKYRVIKNSNNASEIFNLANNIKHNDLLLNEIGLYTINHELQNIFNKYSAELELITEVKKELKNKNRPVIITEGISDKIHFETAYRLIYSKDLRSSYILCDNLYAKDGSSIGDGAGNLNNFLNNFIGKINVENKIIAIFDSDEEGMTQIKGLKQNYVNVASSFDGCLVYKHKTKHNVFAITLVSPDFRNEFTDMQNPCYSYLSTELLFRDDTIPLSNRKYPSKNDISVFSFHGNKVAFAESLSQSLTKNDVEGFQPTFTLIEKIARSNN